MNSGVLRNSDTAPVVCTLLSSSRAHHVCSLLTCLSLSRPCQAVEDDVSSVADKRSKDDSKKTPKKIAGSGSIDLFFLSNALKLLTLATPFFWKTVYLLPVYAAWKAYGMFTGAKSAMQGLAGGAPAPATPDWEPAVEDEDDDTRKQKRANKRATKTR